MKLYGTAHKAYSKGYLVARQHLKRLAVVGMRCRHCGGNMAIDDDRAFTQGYRLICLWCGREGDNITSCDIMLLSVSPGSRIVEANTATRSKGGRR